jgi:hypothetical protein
MELGFQLTALWNDADVIEIRVTAWNGLFGGTADVYVAIGQLGKIAAQLEGFPKKSIGCSGSDVWSVRPQVCRWRSKHAILLR